jgi:serine/threonine protein kinase
LADFGLTSEGMSREAYTASSAPGTPGYRAPEMLSEDAGVCSDKADIWAMVCILYELAIPKKPYKSDFAVMDYKRFGRIVDVGLDESYNEIATPQYCQKHSSNVRIRTKG